VPLPFPSAHKGDVLQESVLRCDLLIPERGVNVDAIKVCGSIRSCCVDVTAANTRQLRTVGIVNENMEKDAEGHA
jgi:hypothetical protein